MDVLPGCRPMPLKGVRYTDRRHVSVRKGQPVPPDLLIIHWSAGRRELEALHRYLGRPSSAESYHLAIDRFGQAGQFLDLHHAAWHAGDGWMPPVNEVLQRGFIPVADPKKPPPRMTNLRSVGLCLCNRGPVEDRDAPGLLAQGREVVAALHRNPVSKAARWEGYPKAQVEKLIELLPALVKACPTLRGVTGHEDITNGFVEGRGTWKGGSKRDPGPAFPWSEIPWSDHGLTPIWYDFERQGWAPRPCPAVA